MSVISNKTMVRCPHCNAEVREDRLDKHIRKVHKTKASRKKKKNDPEEKKLRQKIRTKKAEMREIDPGKKQTHYYDERYGEKYVGLSEREVSRFGTIPLYDDYSEESDPD